MKFAFMKSHMHLFGVERMSKVLGVSKAGFYRYLAFTPSKRQQENSRLVSAIKAAHKKSRQTYGYRRIKFELEATGGISVSNYKVLRLMKLNNIRAKAKRQYKTTTQSKHSLNISENRLQREFATTEPNKKWVSDITYIPTKEGFLYCAVILDLFSRKIVGMKMDDNLSRFLVIDAFSQAILRRKCPKGLMFHSDRGVQYASNEFRELLKYYGIVQSMSRKGNCWDNAVSESFFGTLKRDLMTDRKFKNRLEAQSAIFEYVEVFYNNDRRHSTLGYLSPNEFEVRFKSGRSIVN